MEERSEPKWQIDFKEYLQRLRCDLKDFREQISFPNVAGVKTVLPLRDLRGIFSLIAINKDLLGKLLRSIPTLNGLYPYKESSFEISCLDSRQLKIGQKFVYRENYQKMLEELTELFQEKFGIACGVNYMGGYSYMVFGLDSKDRYAMSFYLPPIVERRGKDLIIMDGIHRNYLAKQFGVAVNAIVIDGVSAPFPCGLRSWSEGRVISLKDKPADIHERYFDLNKNLFRDLKYLGIDG